MIDIHAHILPGYDDGAKDLDEALQMARLAVADGVQQLVATPHSTVCCDESALRRRIRDLQNEIDLAGIALRLVPGLEVNLVPRAAEAYLRGAIFPIARGPYMLVELPLLELPPYLAETIFALQLAGITPVLAHAERYRAFCGDLAPLYELVEKGVLVQITAGSLLGAFGRPVEEQAKTLLAKRLAHVIASDAHSHDTRPPVLSAACRRAAQLVGEGAALAMVTTVPAAIVGGEAVEIPEPLVPQAKRSWFSWSRSK